MPHTNTNTLQYVHRHWAPKESYGPSQQLHLVAGAGQGYGSGHGRGLAQGEGTRHRHMPLPDPTRMSSQVLGLSLLLGNMLMCGIQPRGVPIEGALWSRNRFPSRFGGVPCTSPYMHMHSAWGSALQGLWPDDDPGQYCWFAICLYRTHQIQVPKGVPCSPAI